MAEQRPDNNMNPEMEEDGLKLLQKIEDMIVYSLPLIEKWSIPHQKLLGDDIAHCMNQMSQLASALTVAYYKKTSISELDEKNKALQSYIRVAFRLKYLNGSIRAWVESSLRRHTKQGHLWKPQVAQAKAATHSFYERQ